MSWVAVMVRDQQSHNDTKGSGEMKRFFLFTATSSLTATLCWRTCQPSQFSQENTVFLCPLQFPPRVTILWYFSTFLTNFWHSTVCTNPTALEVYRFHPHKNKDTLNIILWCRGEVPAVRLYQLSLTHSCSVLISKETLDLWNSHQICMCCFLIPSINYVL